MYFLFYFAFAKIPSDSADFLRTCQVAGMLQFGRRQVDWTTKFSEVCKSRLKSKPRILLHRDLHHHGPSGVRL